MPTRESTYVKKFFFPFCEENNENTRNVNILTKFTLYENYFPLSTYMRILKQ